MLIFAHRGASGHAPENTLTAISKALEMGVDGIEVDVYEVDDQLVVIHDRWLQRTTSGQGNVQKQTFDYLRSLDAGEGQQIPILEEVMALIAGQCLLNIELKGIITFSNLFSLLDKAQREYDFDTNKLLISSFNHRLLNIIHQQKPEYRIGALTASYPLDYARFAERLSAYSVNISVDFVSHHFVEDAHKRGLQVYVYTVDEESDIDEMKAIGVDGIFSNYPTKVKARIAHN